MGRRSGRAAARRAAQAMESTPKTFEHLEDDEDEDETMADPDADVDQDTPIDAPEEEEEEAPKAGSGDDDAHPSDEESAKSPSPPPVIMIRRKRLGRPPKNKPPGWDEMIEVPAREADLTPRRRGRGGWRGRGGRKGAPMQPTQQAIDKEGTMMDIVDDEVALPEDPQGETKVDKMGNLQGGREYRCRTFTVQGRGDRLYMLSTEPARCVGFRDSYLFFTKHRRLFKIIVDDDEKRDMIDREIIPHSYKGRSIGIVTARSVFREFGALIVVGGKRVIDDYEVAKAREDGVTEGELADPSDHFIVGEEYNKLQYVAWHGASAVYHTGAPTVPAQAGKTDPKKRKVAVNDTNWQLEHAREASQFNITLTAARKHNLNGVYDIHTNSVHYPQNLQPTRARAYQIAPHREEEEACERFPAMEPKLARNRLVTDIHLETPPAGIAAASYERATKSAAGSAYDGDFLDSFRGLGSISDEIKDLLPPECRAAFDAALTREAEWHGQWGTEADKMARQTPVVDKAIVPYSMMQ